MPFCAGGMGCVKQPGTWVCSAGLMAKGINPNLLSLALDVVKVNASEGKYGLNARSFSWAAWGRWRQSRAQWEQLPVPHLTLLSWIFQAASEWWMLTGPLFFCFLARRTLNCAQLSGLCCCIMNSSPCSAHREALSSMYLTCFLMSIKQLCNKIFVAASYTLTVLRRKIR